MDQPSAAVLQRVKSASVTVDSQLISTIGKGILVFAAVGKDDTTKSAESMASKVLKLKMWEDDTGAKWKRSVQDINGEILCVSQFTLLATTKKHKPSFHASASSSAAATLYTHFFRTLQSLHPPSPDSPSGDKVKDGVFQAMMDVALVNDGPVGVDYVCVDGEVTLEIDTDPPKEEKNENENGEGSDGGEGGMRHVDWSSTLWASLLE